MAAVQVRARIVISSTIVVIVVVIVEEQYRGLGGEGVVSKGAKWGGSKWGRHVGGQGSELVAGGHVTVPPVKKNAVCGWRKEVRG